MASIPANYKNSCGILLGKVNDIYSMVCSKITNQEFSIVGVYYHDGNMLNALIYRIFDGTIYPFLTHEMDFERLSTHQMVEEMFIYQFNQEGWLLDGNRDLLSNRLRIAINRCILQNVTTPDYKKLITHYMLNNINGNNGDNIINGYYRINEILLAITNDDPNHRKGFLDRNIVDCKYLDKGYNIVKDFKREYNDPPKEMVLIDSQRRLNDLAKSIVSLICEEPSYCDVFISNKFIIKEDNPPLTSPITPDQIDIKEELSQLKLLIDTLIQSFITKSTPIISAVDLIKIYNNLAVKCDVDPIEPVSPIIYNSVGALLTSSFDKLETNTVEVDLRSGSTLYIPCTGEGIEKLSDDERLEVLRYVLSLRRATNSYNSLLDIIVRECASKTSQNYVL